MIFHMSIAYCSDATAFLNNIVIPAYQKFIRKIKDVIYSFFSPGSRVPESREFLVHLFLHDWMQGVNRQ